jgi:thiamine-phosphate pyrophosphorylase
VIPRPHGRPIVCFVTDRTRLPGHSVSDLLRRIHIAALAGVDIVHIRERDLTDRRLTDLVREAVAVTAGTDAQIVVNDRADVALAAGAAGVHLREDSIAVARVRNITPPAFIVGRSVHSVEGADAVARAGGCDYLVFGTVYPSLSKSPDAQVAGEARLAEVCRRVTLPVLAIGGVDETRAAAVAAAGAAGIAGIGVFMGGDEATLEARVSAIRRVFDSGSRLV